MKFSNTKNQFKSVGKDAVKLVKDVFKIPHCFGDDIRQHRASLKRYEEWLASQDTKSETPADAQ